MQLFTIFPNCTEDFLKNEKFINLIYIPTNELVSAWQDFFSRHPDLKIIANQAHQILTDTKESPKLGEIEKKQLFNQIIDKCQQKATLTQCFVPYEN